MPGPGQPDFEFATHQEVADKLLISADNAEWDRKDFKTADFLRKEAARLMETPDAAYIPF